MFVSVCEWARMVKPLRLGVWLNAGFSSRVGCIKGINPTKEGICPPENNVLSRKREFSTNKGSNDRPSRSMSAAQTTEAVTTRERQAPPVRALNRH